MTKSDRHLLGTQYEIRELNAREHAAIQLRVPDSGTDWLDAMIRQSLRQEFAKAAMQGAVDFSGESSYAITDVACEVLAETSCAIADALLAELAKETKE